MLTDAAVFHFSIILMLLMPQYRTKPAVTRDTHTPCSTELRRHSGNAAALSHSEKPKPFLLQLAPSLSPAGAWACSVVEKRARSRAGDGGAFTEGCEQGRGPVPRRFGLSGEPSPAVPGSRARYPGPAFGAARRDQPGAATAVQRVNKQTDRVEAKRRVPLSSQLGPFLFNFSYFILFLKTTEVPPLAAGRSLALPPCFPPAPARGLLGTAMRPPPPAL